MVAIKSNRTQQPCYVKLALQISFDIIEKVKFVIDKKKKIYTYLIFSPTITSSISHNFSSSHKKIVHLSGALPLEDWRTVVALWLICSF